MRCWLIVQSPPHSTTFLSLPIFRRHRLHLRLSPLPPYTFDGASLFRPLPTNLDKLGHHAHHEREQADGLTESETKNRVLEQLAAYARVACRALNEGGEDEADTHARPGEADGASAHAEIARDLDQGARHLGRVGAAGLAGAGLEGGAKDVGGLLALEGLKRCGSSAEGWGDA